jgi:hypothetical protein
MSSASSVAAGRIAAAGLLRFRNSGMSGTPPPPPVGTQLLLTGQGSALRVLTSGGRGHGIALARLMRAANSGSRGMSRLIGAGAGPAIMRKGRSQLMPILRPDLRALLDVFGTKTDPGDGGRKNRC